jgi:hypothetical protein
MAPGHRCCAVADSVVGDTTPTDASNVSALGNTAGVVCYKNIYTQCKACNLNSGTFNGDMFNTQTYSETLLRHFWKCQSDLTY